MSQLQSAPTAKVFYPEDDGQPLSNNTEQFRWIVVLKENLELLFAERVDVFIAGDLLWYPVEGDNATCQAPDVMVVLGRPKGKRGSYKQWEEDNLPPQIVFEILSPGNRLAEMFKKFKFYEKYGVQEYYIYVPESVELLGWQRQAGELEAIAADLNGWISPLLQIRFDLTGTELQIFQPNGERFLSYLEIAQRLAQTEQALQQERNRSQVLADRLREMGIDPEQL